MAKTYARNSYKNPFSASVQRNNAKGRGWGSGWPNCQGSKMKTVLIQDTDPANKDIRITVRGEVAPMVADLLEATDKVYNLIPAETGAYNCRKIAGTSTASNHSWGLAVDINWNHNPMSTTFHSELPPAIVAMWNACGWFWGGFYANRKDTMHFEYVGSPSDVAMHAALAKKYNSGDKPEAPKPTTTPSTGKFGAYNTGAYGARKTKRWDRGDDVKLLQRFFGLEDDGFFGADTATRVMMWQNDHSLKATGIVAKPEWKLIKAALKIK